MTRSTHRHGNSVADQIIWKTKQTSKYGLLSKVVKVLSQVRNYKGARKNVEEQFHG